MPEGQQSNGSWDDDEPDRSLRGRLSRMFLKPVDPTAPHAEVAPERTVEELEAENRYADDRERLIGLIAAPLAAVVAIVVIGADTAKDPKAFLANGKPNPLHTPVSTYNELLIILLVMAVIMLATAWFRKRLYFGVVTAMFGLAIFNLKWWGFGVPFVLAGAWYLVRAYRTQRALREATGEQPSRARGRAAGGAAPGRLPRPNKRYTPPTARPKKSPPKPEDE
jgi:hypothetical protein